MITALVTVVIASAGTAVAVTATVVNIADPVNPSRVARVDGAGRLAVAPPNATIVSAGLTGDPDGDNFVTSPTTATLAITKLTFTNPSINSEASFAEVRYFLYQTGVFRGTCSVSVTPVLLGIYNIAPGDDFEETFTAPLIVKPVTASAPYCIDLFAQTLNGLYTGNFLPAYNVTAYVVSGKYTGVGAEPTPVSPQVLGQQESAATP